MRGRLFVFFVKWILCDFSILVLFGFEAFFENRCLNRNPVFLLSVIGMSLIESVVLNGWCMLEGFAEEIFF